MTTSICPQCKSVNADDVKRCEHCGWPLDRKRRWANRERDVGFGMTPRRMGAILGLLTITFVAALLKSWAE